MNNNSVEIPNFMQNIYKEREQEKLKSEIQRKEMYIANKKRSKERKQLKIEFDFFYIYIDFIDFGWDGRRSLRGRRPQGADIGRNFPAPATRIPFV